MKASRLMSALEKAVDEHGDFEVDKTLSRKIRMAGEKQSYSNIDCSIKPERARAIEKGDAEPRFSEFMELIEVSVGDSDE